MKKQGKFLNKSLEEFLLKLIHNSLTQLFMKLLEESIREYLEKKEVTVQISGEILGIISNVTPVQIFEGTILKKKTLEKFLKASLKVLLTFQDACLFEPKTAPRLSYVQRAKFFWECCTFYNDARLEELKESF